MKILIINGPNLNLLGVREPKLYGSRSYEELCTMLKGYAAANSLECEIMQSNYEGALVDAVQKAYFEHFDGIIINAAAYTHTSIALADALAAVAIPTVEVHVTDINSRELYRRQSFLTPHCQKTICGKGLEGYIEAMQYFTAIK